MWAQNYVNINIQSMDIGPALEVVVRCYPDIAYITYRDPPYRTVITSTP